MAVYLSGRMASQYEECCFYHRANHNCIARAVRARKQCAPTESLQTLGPECTGHHYAAVLEPEACTHEACGAGQQLGDKPVANGVRRIAPRLDTRASHTCMITAVPARRFAPVRQLIHPPKADAQAVESRRPAVSPHHSAQPAHCSAAMRPGYRRHFWRHGGGWGRRGLAAAAPLPASRLSEALGNICRGRPTGQPEWAPISFATLQFTHQARIAVLAVCAVEHPGPDPGAGFLSLSMGPLPVSCSQVRVHCRYQA